MYEYISSDCIPILVGGNAKENHAITTTSPKEYWWAHVFGVPGSHVIIKTNREVIPKETKNDAITLAAYHSKSTNQKSIFVHLCRVSDVVEGKHTGEVILEGSTQLLNICMNKQNTRMKRLLNTRVHVKTWSIRTGTQ